MDKRYDPETGELIEEGDDGEEAVAPPPIDVGRQNPPPPREDMQPGPPPPQQAAPPPPPQFSSMSYGGSGEAPEQPKAAVMQGGYAQRRDEGSGEAGVAPLAVPGMPKGRVTDIHGRTYGAYDVNSIGFPTQMAQQQMASLQMREDPEKQWRVQNEEAAITALQHDKTLSPEEQQRAIMPRMKNIQALDPDGLFRKGGALSQMTPVGKAMSQRVQTLPDGSGAWALQPDGKLTFEKMDNPAAKQAEAASKAQAAAAKAADIAAASNIKQKSLAEKEHDRQVEHTVKLLYGHEDKAGYALDPKTQEPDPKKTITPHDERLAEAEKYVQGKEMIRRKPYSRASFQDIAARAKASGDSDVAEAARALEDTYFGGPNKVDPGVVGELHQIINDYAKHGPKKAVQKIRTQLEKAASAAAAYKAVAPQLPAVNPFKGRLSRERVMPEDFNEGMLGYATDPEAVWSHPSMKSFAGDKSVSSYVSEAGKTYGDYLKEQSPSLAEHVPVLQQQFEEQTRQRVRQQVIDRGAQQYEGRGAVGSAEFAQENTPVTGQYQHAVKSISEGASKERFTAGHATAEDYDKLARKQAEQKTIEAEGPYPWSSKEAAMRTGFGVANLGVDLALAGAAKLGLKGGQLGQRLVPGMIAKVGGFAGETAGLTAALSTPAIISGTAERHAEGEGWLGALGKSAGSEFIGNALFGAAGAYGGTKPPDLLKRFTNGAWAVLANREIQADLGLKPGTGIIERMKDPEQAKQLLADMAHDATFIGILEAAQYAGDVLRRRGERVDQSAMDRAAIEHAIKDFNDRHGEPVTLKPAPEEAKQAMSERLLPDIEKQTTDPVIEASNDVKLARENIQKLKDRGITDPEVWADRQKNLEEALFREKQHLASATEGDWWKAGQERKDAAGEIDKTVAENVATGKEARAGDIETSRQEAIGQLREGEQGSPRVSDETGASDQTSEDGRPSEAAGISPDEAARRKAAVDKGPPHPADSAAVSPIEAQAPQAVAGGKTEEGAGRPPQAGASDVLGPGETTTAGGEGAGPKAGAVSAKRPVNDKAFKRYAESLRGSGHESIGTVRGLLEGNDTTAARHLIERAGDIQVFVSDAGKEDFVGRHIKTGDNDFIQLNRKRPLTMRELAHVIAHEATHVARGKLGRELGEAPESSVFEQSATRAAESVSGFRKGEKPTREEQDHLRREAGAVSKPAVGGKGGPYGFGILAGTREWETKDKYVAAHPNASAAEVEEAVRKAHESERGPWAVIADSPHAESYGIHGRYETELEAHRAMMKLKQEYENTGIEFRTEHKPLPPKEGGAVSSETVDVSGTHPISPEARVWAEQLLKSVDEGGVPAFITNKLRRIADDVGVTIGSDDTPNDVIGRIRESVGKTSPETVEPTKPVVPGTLNERQARLKKLTDAATANEDLQGMVRDQQAGKKIDVEKMMGTAGFNDVEKDMFRLYASGEGQGMTLDQMAEKLGMPSGRKRAKQVQEAIAAKLGNPEFSVEKKIRPGIVAENKDILREKGKSVTKEELTNASDGALAQHESLSEKSERQMKEVNDKWDPILESGDLTDEQAQDYLRELSQAEAGAYRSQRKGKGVQEERAGGGRAAEGEQASETPDAAGAEEKVGFGKPLSAEEKKAFVSGGSPEAGESRLRATAMKNEQVDQERVDRKLPPLMAAARRANPEVWDQAMRLLESDPEAGSRAVEKIASEQRPPNKIESALLLHRKIALDNEYSRVVSEYVKAFREKKSTPEEFALMEQKADDLSGRRDALDKVISAAGNELGWGLQFRKQFAAEDFSLATMQKKLEMAKGEPLTEKELGDVSDLQKKIEKLQEKLDDSKGENAELRVALKNAKGEFKEKIVKVKDSKMSAPQKVFRATTDILDASRALITSVDFPVLRQGAFFAFGHPIKTAKAIPEMLRAFGSKHVADMVLDQIHNRPNASLYERSGLWIADPSKGISGQEEAYIGRFVQKIPGIAHAERAYSTFLNRMRADVFDSMAASLGRGGQIGEAEAKVVSNFVNAATGRGTLKSPIGDFEKAATPLARVFFSPRFVASRFQLLAGQPLYKGTAATRTAIAAEYARALVGVGIFYVLAKAAMPDSSIEWDPRSSDFGKIKIGNTRIDPLAGLAQVVTLGSRIAKGETKNQKGEIVPIRGPKVKYGGTTTPDVVQRFVRSKLAPVPGAVVDIASGEDFLGEPTTVGSVTKKLTFPIAAEDIYKAMQDQGVPNGVAASLLSIMGMNVSTYKKKPVKHGVK